MNKETIDYTSEEFWKDAGEGYDYYVIGNGDSKGNFHKSGSKGYYDSDGCYWDYGDEGIHFIVYKRPATFTKAVQENAVSNSDNWFVDGKCVSLPPVGTVCEIWGTVGQTLRKMESDWVEVEIITHTDFGGAPIAVAKDLNCATLGWGTTAVFRPIKKEPTIQEKILEAWKAQGIDFAYDNEDTNFSFKVLVDFVVNNFDVKEKE